MKLDARDRRLIDLTSQYLQSQNSGLSTRDYLSTIWAIGQGGASLLNSSFYQRYLGRRDTLRVALVQQMLDLPKQYPSLDETDDDMVELVNQIDSESEAHLQAQDSSNINKQSPLISD